jgi:hypothetical protein
MLLQPIKKIVQSMELEKGIEEELCSARRQPPVDIPPKHG